MAKIANRTKLTKRVLDALVYDGDGKSRYIVWDTVVTGLGARIYPSGRKAFVFSYRLPGQNQKRLITLGGYGSALTVDQARTKARKEHAKILDGDDPLLNRNREISTFGDLVDAYKTQVSARKKTCDQDQRRFAKNIPLGWAGRRLDLISRADVNALHRKIGQTAPYEANRVLALLSSTFNQAEDLLGAAPEPGWQNPTKGIRKYPELKRDRWVRPNELKRLAKAIDEEPNIYVRSALWLCLLTGARKSEILTAKWEQVDWDNRCLYLPDTKAGRPQTIPLSAPALALIAAIPKLAGNPYLLPGQRKNHHLVNISKPWLSIRQRAGLPDVRIHDLRRTVGSWMSQSGIDLNRIKDALRHSNISTTLTYARLGQDHVREAMEDHGRRLLEVLGVDQIEPAQDSGPPAAAEVDQGHQITFNDPKTD